MGGTRGKGNMFINPNAEYNVYQDADAASIIFNLEQQLKLWELI